MSQKKERGKIPNFLFLNIVKSFFTRPKMRRKRRQRVLWRVTTTAMNIKIVLNERW